MATTRKERLEALRDRVIAMTHAQEARLRKERRLLRAILGDARDGALDKSKEADELLILASIEEVMDVG